MINARSTSSEAAVVVLCEKVAANKRYIMRLSGVWKINEDYAGLKAGHALWYRDQAKRPNPGVPFLIKKLKTSNIEEIRRFKEKAAFFGVMSTKK